ncbi:hypothetical protein U9M48_022955, partial [Paspalum notatum var. saurae]
MKLGSNCDSVDNNICESFNKWIIEPRYFPIISMLEAIRCKVMIRIHDMSTKVAMWQQGICPNILKKLKSQVNSSAYCHAISCGRDTFEVQHNDHKWTVDLEKKTCSCRYWQLAGLPCCHAISCIYYKTNKLDDYIASCFTVKEIQKTYAHLLQPVEGIQNWPTSQMAKPLPPKTLKMLGKPKKERRREPHEKPKDKRMSKIGCVIRCKICKQPGHNKSTCARRGTGECVTSTNKRKQPCTVSTSKAKKKCTNVGFLCSEKTATTIQNPAKSNQRPIVTFAEGRVATIPGGTASLRLEANVPSSQATAKVSIKITSGIASARVKVQEPSSRKAPSTTTVLPKMAQ